MGGLRAPEGVRGAERAVLFSGLTPGFVALAQINVQLGAADAGSVPVFITVNGIASNAVTVYVAQ